MNSAENPRFQNFLNPVSEKGRNKWSKTLLWGAGSFIVFATLSTPLVGAMAALLGGTYGYKKASTT
jgi:hypothetical protein